MIPNNYTKPRNGVSEYSGLSGVCYLWECQKWINGELYYPILYRELKHGFALCTNCGVSYGTDVITFDEDIPINYQEFNSFELG